MENTLDLIDKRYEIGRKLGAGGSGDVYLAYDRVLRRNVVIKCLRPDGDHGSELDGILEEAGKMASMRHPNVVGIYDIILDANLPCIVMEHVAGENLEERVIRTGPMSPTQLVDVARQTLEALACAHAVPLIHRDLKPSNIMISDLPNGSLHAKLLDFGMAKYFQDDAPSPQTVAIDGTIRASIFFISPEQLKRQPVDLRCDLYSLGCALYFAVTGAYPFPGDTVPEVIASHLNNNVLPVSQIRPEVGQHLNDWLMRLLRQHPSERLESSLVALQALFEAAGADGVLLPMTASIPTVTSQIPIEAAGADGVLIPTTASNPTGPMAIPMPQAGQAKSGKGRLLGAVAAGIALGAAVLLGGAMLKPFAFGSGTKRVFPEWKKEIDSNAKLADKVYSTPQTTEVSSETNAPSQDRPVELPDKDDLIQPPVSIAPRPVPTAQLLTASKPTPVAFVKPVTAPVQNAIVPPKVVYEVSGSNTIGAKLMPELMKTYLSQIKAKDIKIEHPMPEETMISFLLPDRSEREAVRIRAHGSSTAFKDLGSRSADIGMSSRPVKDEEVGQLSALGDMRSLACEHVIGLDGLAIIVHQSNPISTLSVSQVAAIFTGEINDWSKVGGKPGAISLYARDDKSGTFDTFRSTVLSVGKLDPKARRFEDSTDLTDQVAADPGAIGFIGLPYVKNSKALALSDMGTQAKLPSPFTVATEDYVLSRRLFLYCPADSNHAWTRSFVEFALCDEGQKIVGKVGFIPQTIDVEKIVNRADMPAPYIEFLSNTSSNRLSLVFRFRSGEAQLDGKSLRDLNRVIAFLARSENRSKRIHLLGFSDSLGGRSANTKLAKERAITVAEELTTRGVIPASVKAMGSTMPVASNENQEGRQKNRRVEVWID